MTENDTIINSALTEEWRAIPGYENLYTISSSGNIKRIGICKTMHRGKYLRSAKSGNGYLTVVLCKEGIRKGFSVHSLVATVFIGERPAGHHVNHKDGIKTNNTARNLEYITPKENQHHASLLGLLAVGDRNGSRMHPEKRKRGINNHKAKLTPDKVRNIRKRFAAHEATVRQLAEEYKVATQSIDSVIKRRTWKHL